ncbi:hypothetical protein EJ06DRAFT_412219 [Trichodelitschia bisporula]|uniref:Uncharacterized protein n=1 Tax=Trichodelitschia bisporula TaxID=703511 RepID=A0A6G1HXV7_9PEZI|nr:hypothetical protein EJ06DRAFT_412219 [Trichodelitschia bisporula]
MSTIPRVAWGHVTLNTWLTTGTCGRRHRPRKTSTGGKRSREIFDDEAVEVPGTPTGTLSPTGGVAKLHLMERTIMVHLLHDYYNDPDNLSFVIAMPKEPHWQHTLVCLTTSIATTSIRAVWMLATNSARAISNACVRRHARCEGDGDWEPTYLCLEQHWPNANERETPSCRVATCRYICVSAGYVQ